MHAHGMYQLLSFTQKKMQITTARTGHRNTSYISTHSHIQRFYVLKVLRKKTVQPLMNWS